MTSLCFPPSMPSGRSGVKIVGAPLDQTDLILIRWLEELVRSRNLLESVVQSTSRGNCLSICMLQRSCLHIPLRSSRNQTSSVVKSKQSCGRRLNELFLAPIQKV